MISLPQFCAQFGIAEESARQALAKPGSEEERVWYVQLVLGIGAWITAIIGLAFVAFFMFELLEMEEPGLGVSAIGIALFVLAYWLLWRPKRGEFLTQLSIAGALCGASLAVLGIGFKTESWWAAIVASLPFALAAIWIGRSWLLQFLLSGLVIGLAALLMFDETESMVVDFVSLTLPVGMVLALRPPRLDLRPTAMVLILALPVTIGIASTLDFGLQGSRLDPGLQASAGWVARLVCLGALAILVAINARGEGFSPSRRPALVAIAIAALLATIMLPSGIAATLATMLIGYTLGNRALAVLGAAGFVYFLWIFYVDLDQTLLVKSIILMVAGATLLAAGYMLSRPSRPEAKS